ncbi:hypothetical protein [Deinococcus frigens]|uniref:hypothetical protein n=1 Tax=Deinococcus frigens TaxID=249403 RepID=UPI0004986531|nr:hypothetical protein [Deinococcus frigens]
MKKLLSALALSLTLASCGTPLLPRTQALGIAGVEFPPTTGPTDSLTVTIRYGVGCGDFDQQVTKTSRTATGLQLSATVKTRNVFLACPAQYVEKTLNYTDPGSPARTNPFEIIVNGKSYGTVTIK